MDGVNELDESDKISNLLDPDAKKQTFIRKSQIDQTSKTKMTFYSYIFSFFALFTLR
ncbi:hypothetical protein HanXRQr2_Chr17g0831161 [Helianthus annuus]|uniref:Uncharacterized protein n=1 Tax=Helianthus annuus TaxID=4232 RepID=A0A9K3GWB8_HELAN|nr:hypothetical protein HanXRQr2_Chr17g0831161 [Helianthus annuus]